MGGDMTAEAVASIGATDIREVMKSQGPIVNTVILRCRPSTCDDNDDEKGDSKPAAIEKTEQKGTAQSSTTEVQETETPAQRVILNDLIEEVKIDTTPSKSKVSEVLGGPFTFLGQYEDEGIVLMIRNFPDDLESDLKDIYDQEMDEDEDEPNNNNNGPNFSFSEQLSKNFNIKALKVVCFQRDIDTEHMTEKRELVQALVDYQKGLPAYNEHQLQPPLHKVRVRGDIVVMKVAETEEELDDDDENEDGDDAGNEKSTETETDNNNNNNNNKKDSENNNTTAVVAAVPTNDEFFLDYSKEAYINFALRTDIPEHDIETEISDDEEEEEGESAEAAGVDNGEDGDEEDSDEGNDEDIDEEEIDEDDKSAMLNLVMNEVLRQFREENGRGPNTKELLELRANIAKELGVEIAQEIDGDWDKKANQNTVRSAKKIFFTKEADMVREYVPDRNEYPSDNDEDEDYDDHDDNDSENNVARSLVMDDYEEEDRDIYVQQPPTKRLKTSEEEDDTYYDEDSKPAAAST